MKFDKSCGAVIVFGDEFLLIKRHEKEGGYWEFPKGHPNRNETEEQTAEREIYEEVGMKVKFIPGFREETQYYPSPDVLKTVVFFIGIAPSKKVKIIDGEAVEYRWLTYDKALKQLTYENGREILRRARTFC